MGDVEVVKEPELVKQESSEKSLAMSDEDRVSSMGLLATINIYAKVKQFIKVLRKRVKNNRYKEKVVEEILKTEQTYIEGLNVLCRWKQELVAEGFITDEEAERLFSNVELIL